MATPCFSSAKYPIQAGIEQSIANYSGKKCSMHKELSHHES